MGEDLFGPPYASHAIDTSMFCSKSGEVPTGIQSSMHASGTLNETIRSECAEEAPRTFQNDSASGEMEDRTQGTGETMDVDMDHNPDNVPEHTQEYSLRGAMMDNPDTEDQTIQIQSPEEEAPLDAPIDSTLTDQGAQDPFPQEALTSCDEVPQDCSDKDYDQNRVLVVFNVQEAEQQDTNTEDPSAVPYVCTNLYVGRLPDPRAGDPTTPPLAQNAVRIEQVFEIMQAQVQDPARGWGVLMSDVRKVLTTERFAENAGSRVIPKGYVTWPVFVRTVLHTLHR